MKQQQMIGRNKMLATITILMLAFASCKKKPSDSPQSKLTGKWKLTKSADDANGNGVMDAAEEFPLPDTIVVFAVFNADGSGSTSDESPGFSYNTTFTWVLINNNTDIKIKEISGGNVGNETTTHIERLSSSDLVTKDVDPGGTSGIYWSVFKKQ